MLTLSQINSSWLVCWLLIWNVAGTQPWHISFEPPTADTSLLKFTWTAELDKLFNDTKALIISKVKQGIQTFDTKRQTCIQCDWSKDGIGYVV